MEGVFPLVQFHWVIAWPSFGLPTPRVYRSLRIPELPPTRRPCVPEPSWSDGMLEEVFGRILLKNDLESAARALRPEMSAFRAVLEKLTAEPISMTGSGSAFLIWLSDPKKAGPVVKRIQACKGLSARAVSALPCEGTPC